MSEHLRPVGPAAEAAPLWAPDLDRPVGPRSPTPIRRPIFPRRIKRRRTVGAVAALLALLGGYLYLGPVALHAAPPLQTAFLFDADGRPLAEIRPEENRVVLPISKIPKLVQQAFVAAEDERFWSHPGIDPFAVARALLANLRGDREGASTITQQYVKNTVVGTKRSFWRKLREAVVAVRLDRRYSKDRILEAYLNSIFLGHGAYGVEAAARLYFGHGVGELTLPEAATLAGVNASPKAFDPRSRPGAARSRRDYVLDRMLTLRMISSSQAAEAKAALVETVPPRHQSSLAPQFVDWVREELLERLGEEVLYRGGLRVTSSLDLDVQRAAEEAVADILDRPGDPDAAVVTIDVATGGVRAMFGGRGRRLGDFNLAVQARRQAGSAFKPFVLAAALERGKTLSDTYRAPGSIRLKIPGGVWSVSNFDNRGRGRISLRSATAYSVNTVYAQLILDVGADAVVDLARRLGFGRGLRAVPSLALGTSGVSALEMAGGYATFARDGEYLRPTGLGRVVDAEDRLLISGERDGRRVLSAGVAEQVREALKAVVRVGTGRSARIPDYVAYGKTGTTEDHADAWFVGAAGGVVTAVWVGYPRGRVPMTDVHGIKVTGSSFPAAIWKRVMTVALAKYRPGDDEATLGRKGSSPASSAPEPSGSPGEEPTSPPSASPSPPPSEPLPIPTIFPRRAGG
jgi:penicillin-binding protein 1A